MKGLSRDDRKEGSTHDRRDIRAGGPHLRGLLYRVAYHALKNRADAEDVTQTVLLKLYQQGDRFESEEHPEALAAAGGGEREPAPAALLLAEPRRAAG